jgi:hypothetical protein
VLAFHDNTGFEFYRCEVRRQECKIISFQNLIFVHLSGLLVNLRLNVLWFVISSESVNSFLFWDNVEIKQLSLRCIAYVVPRKTIDFTCCFTCSLSMKLIQSKRMQREWKRLQSFSLTCKLYCSMLCTWRANCSLNFPLWRKYNFEGVNFLYDNEICSVLTEVTVF